VSFRQACVTAGVPADRVGSPWHTGGGWAHGTPSPTEPIPGSCRRSKTPGRLAPHTPRPPTHPGRVLERNRGPVPKPSRGPSSFLELLRAEKTLPKSRTLRLWRVFLCRNDSVQSEDHRFSPAK